MGTERNRLTPDGRPGALGRRSRALITVTAIVALLLGVFSAFSLVVTVVALAVSITLTVALWARLRGDLLVVAVALLVFWAPFHTTVSRFNVSPQEAGVYLVCVTIAALDLWGVRQWLKDFVTGVPRASQVALAIFALACVQSLVWASGVGALDRLQALRATLIYPVLLALLVVYTIRTRQAERVVLRAFFWGATLFALYALTLKIWGVDVSNGAVTGRLGAESSFLSQYHPNNVGLYLALALPFALPLWHEARRSLELPRLKAGVVLASAALMGVDIVLAASRGTLAALGISLLVALGFLFWRGTSMIRSVLVSTAAGALLGVVGLVAWKGSLIFARYAVLLHPSALLSDPNVVFRLRLYTQAARLIAKRPLTGIGFGAFSTLNATPYSPHDTYLDLWVSIGVLGLLAFVFVLGHGIWTSLRRAWMYSRAKSSIGLYYSLSFALALISFVTQGFVEAYSGQPRIAPAMWILALAAQVVIFKRVAPPDTLALRPRSRVTAPIAEDVSDRSSSHAVSASLARDEIADEIVDEVGWDTGPMTGQYLTVNAELLPVITSDHFQISGEIQAVALSSAIRERGATRQDKRSDAAVDDAPQIGMTVAAPEADAEPTTGRRMAIQTADTMLRKAPGSYFWNQLYWVLTFGLNLLLSVVIARRLSAADYGVYAILSTIVGVLVLLFAFGLEDASSVFVPRVLARDGQAAAASLIRRTLLMRIGVMISVSVLLAASLPLVASVLQQTGLAPRGLAQMVGGPATVRSVILGVYLAGSGVVALQGAFLSALLNTRAILIIGGATQAIGLILTLALLNLGLGIDGVFVAQSIATWLALIAFLIALFPYLVGRPAHKLTSWPEMRRLMLSAWLTNITNGALGKQMDIMLMSVFAVSYAAIGYYNLAYQLVTIVGVLLISGLGGVSIATMSAAYTAHGVERLASLWRATLMLQLLLAVPLQILTFILADQILGAVYGSQYLAAAPLLRIFLAFSLVGRMMGGGANQSALYIVGKQRVVLTARWTGLILNIILDVLLIQLAGPAGALIATGFSQLWVGVVEYVALKEHIHNRYPWGFALRVLLFSAMGGLGAAALGLGGLPGLVSRGVLFIAIFLGAVLFLKLGDARDIVEVASLNPRVQWVISGLIHVSPGSMRRRDSAV